ncbi:MAG: immunoglobulin domain-containing protein, partial [Phycisphaerae bacterium]
VYDISDVANTPPVFLGNVGGNNTHSMWPTDDGEYVVVGEERGGGGIQVYRMTDTGGSISFTETDSLVLSADAFSVHNQVVIGNRVYISWYQAGLQVFDINAISGELEFVASYDTSIFDGTASGFQGCWGTYPLLGEDKILLSDLENGLLVVSVQGPLVSFDYPDGFPSLSDPSGGTPVRVVVNAEAETPDPGSVTLFSRVDGGAFTGSPMPFDGAAFAGALPSAPCGSTIDYYVSVQTLEGSTITSPADAPASFQSVLSALGFVDIEVVDFESDPGWSVSGDATDGEWIRGTPLAECDRGNPIADFDGSGQCFLTDNILGGGPNACNNDVDGGTTILTTSSYDLSSISVPYVSYARWFSNNFGSGANEDEFIVEVSNNGGSTWEILEVVGPAGPEAGGGWITPSLRVDDVIAVTNNMQFRFSSGDLINGSVVEAGIDDFRIQELVCGVNEDPAEVTASPQSQSVCEGDDVVFSVSASGAQPLTFQWRLNGGNIGGATSSVLNIQDVVPGDAGSYTCVVSNGFGSDESASATLSVTSLASCDDGNACTVDSCAAAACSSIDNTPAGECCDPATGDLTTIDDGNDCSTDICDPGTGDVTYSINVPAIVGAGGRSLNVTPDIACGDPIALVISSVELPCFEFYVAADGSLTGAPVFQTAATWSTVTISSEEIIPGTSYSVQSEVPGGTRSVVASGETWAWGDVDQNTVANFADVQLVVLGFQNDFSLVTVAAADLDPCMPNGIINFGDILRAVSAFQGQTY